MALTEQTTGASEADGDRVQIFTDGACSGNPGPGGWGALLRYRGHETELWGGEPDTTNNRIELMAVIAGLFVLFLPFAVYAFVVTPTKAHKSRDLTHGLLEKDADPDPDTRDQENTTTEKDSTFVAINKDLVCCCPNCCRTDHGPPLHPPIIWCSP